jgi:hypothetical protein
LNVANPIALLASATDLANLTVTIWAGIWIALAGVFAYRARHGDGLRAAGWMIAIAAFLAAQEDPGLLVYMASIAPGVDRDGVLGLVHPHTPIHAQTTSPPIAIAAWILIWAFALWFCRPQLRRSFGGSPETTRVRGGEQ